jgi:hypothetical protein
MGERHPEKLRARYALDQHRASVVADAEGCQAIAITEDVFLRKNTTIEIATWIN